jgi:succinate dehydrogenase / fumarate reductase cytochrome b subunit
MSFSYFQGIASHWFAKLILLALIWAYMQHFCAGVRHLFMDVHFGLDKDSARKSAASVLTVSLLLTAVVGLKLFGVF